MDNKEKIILVATYSLVAIVIAMIAMFILAIIGPAVDDNIVFQIVGPAFQTIVGGFIGLITGIKIGQTDE
jgi:multisubunit Na+/H+ antiporter MnhF subunit